MNKSHKLQAFAANAEETARREQIIQKEVDRKDKIAGAKSKTTEPMQAGPRPYPDSFPKQHLVKPGLESELQVQPMYQAPHYRGSGKLEDMVALITGGDSGIGRAVAVLYAREGANVAIVYLAEEQSDAEETRRAVEAEGRRALLIPGDVRESEFCRKAVKETIREYGQLDVLVNNAAFQQHQKKLEDVTEEQWDRTFKTNIYGYFHMAQAA